MVNPRKRVKLAPSAASLMTFSFVLLFSSSMMYAVLFPGFSAPSSYAASYVEKSSSSSSGGIIGALMSGSSSETSSAGATDESSGVSNSSSLAQSSFFTLVGRSAEVAVTKVESAATKDAGLNDSASGESSSDGDSAGSSSSGDASGSSGSSSDDSFSGGDSSNASLSAAEENEFHAFLVGQFNQCVQLSGSLRESSGHLQYDANLGDFSDAAQWYSDMLAYDSSIDSMKAALNMKVAVAERSRYYRFWEEIEYMVNDLGAMSAPLVQQWARAAQSGTANAVDTSAAYASYRAHEDKARSLA